MMQTGHTQAEVNFWPYEMYGVWNKTKLKISLRKSLIAKYVFTQINCSQP